VSGRALLMHKRIPSLGVRCARASASVHSCDISASPVRTPVRAVLLTPWALPKSDSPRRCRAACAADVLSRHMGVLRPDPTEWLAMNPDRQCSAQSRQQHRRCRQISVRGKTKCHYHGGSSRGPHEVNWNCRPGGLEKKMARLRQQRAQRGSGSDSPDAGSTSRSSHELTACDIELLMASRER